MAFFNIYKYQHCFATKENEAYFWHGQTTENDEIFRGWQNAKAIAEEHDGKTLEMCMLDHREELEEAGVIFSTGENGEMKIVYNGTEEETNNFWDVCSHSFAEQACGEVHVIEGTDERRIEDENEEYYVKEVYYENSVWNRKEHETLEHNNDVSCINTVSPVTGEETGEVESFDRQSIAYQDDYGYNW